MSIAISYSAPKKSEWMRTCSPRLPKSGGPPNGLHQVDEYITGLEDWRTWGDEICLKFLPDLIQHLGATETRFRRENRCMSGSSCPGKVGMGEIRSP